MTDEVPRILFVSDKFGYPGGVAHGGTTYFLNVLPALIEVGVDLTTCFLRDPHPAADDLRLRGVDPIFLSALRVDPTAAIKLATLARRNRCTVIHAAGIKAILMARMAARLVPTRTIVHVHDQKHPGTLVSNLHRWFSQPADLGVCVSQAVAETAVNGYHVARERLRVVPNGIDLGRFNDVPHETRAALRAALGITPSAKVLGMFGRFYPVKGHHLMLNMMPRIIEACPDAVLLMAGDGPERKACESLAKRLGLGRNVLFLGHRSDIPELLTTCDIFVMTSETEGLPIAAIESLAAGKPVVCFDVGGMREVIDDKENGYVVPYGDAPSFIEAAVRLLNESDRRQILSEGARKAAERFTLGEHVRRLLQCYQEVSSYGGTAGRTSHDVG